MNAHKEKNNHSGRSGEIKLHGLIKAAFAAKRRLGLIPYEGRWLDAKQVKIETTLRRRQRKFAFVEITFVVFGFFVLGFALLFILLTIAY